jgi:hypothetical protein
MEHQEKRTNRTCSLEELLYPTGEIEQCYSSRVKSKTREMFSMILPEGQDYRKYLPLFLSTTKCIRTI